MTTAGLGGAAVAATALAAPSIVRAQAPLKWRLQTYSGAPLGAHVIKPQIDAFNAAANGEMEIELYYADQLVPTAELFRALQNGTIDAVQSDDATESDRIITEAKSQATRIVGEAEETSARTLEKLEQERSLLERKIDELRVFERDYRTRLKSYLENLLGDLDSRGSTVAPRQGGEPGPVFNG